MTSPSFTMYSLPSTLIFPASFTLVSLPKEWVDAHNLSKSSQVQIETSENSLSITAGEGKKLSKEIEIEYPLPNEENIAANITGAYLLGYNIIKINGVIV